MFHDVIPSHKQYFENILNFVSEFLFFWHIAETFYMNTQQIIDLFRTQFDSSLTTESITLTQSCPKQCSAYLDEFPESAQLGSALSRITGALVQRFSHIFHTVNLYT